MCFGGTANAQERQMIMPHDALWSNTSVSASIGLRRERVLAGLHVQVRTLARDSTCWEYRPAALT